MNINECSCGCGNTGDCSASERPQRYMFFGNLMTLKNAIDAILSMDQDQVDEILSNGHDWAADHIASSTDDVQEVANFLINQTAHQGSHGKRDLFHEEDIKVIKTFESFIDGISRGK